MSNTYCPLPWMHLASHPNGSVSLCCHADHTGFTGFSKSEYPHFTKYWNLNRDEIAVIHNSDTFRQTRDAMLGGRKAIACKKCWVTEAAGGKSKRQEEIVSWPQYNIEWAKKNTEDGGYIKPDLAFIELRLGNVCNLKCVTCNPISSNMWQEDYDAVSSKLEFVDQGMHSKNRSIDNNAWTTDRRFWNDLLESSWWARKIYINGGEPTHNLEHLWYLEQLAERDLAHNITLWYSTNVTHLPKKMLEVWKKFKKVEISASIDDLGSHNEYIRYPSKWEKTFRVLAELESIPNVEVTVVQTLGALNFMHLKEFYNWLETNNRKWSINFVTAPDYLSVDALPKSVRERLLEGYKKTLPPHIYQQLNTRCRNEDTPDLTSKFVLFITELDKIRGTDVNVSLPGLMDLIFNG